MLLSTWCSANIAKALETALLRPMGNLAAEVLPTLARMKFLGPFLGIFSRALGRALVAMFLKISTRR